MSLVTGAVLQNRYRIVKMLGEGGFSKVYRAWDMHINKAVAIKENLDTNPESVKQFCHEGEILSKLDHPNLAKVTDFFDIPSQGQYLVMDLVEGQDLDEMYRQNGPLPEQDVIQWVLQICDALSYLHSQHPPIVHRDIKPANIKITPKNKAVLVDFGIAKYYDPTTRTVKGARAVTPGFSPPEQYGFGNTDPRSDVYALGATMFAVLTGKEPPESVDMVSGKAEKIQSKTVRTINPVVSVSTSVIIERAVKTDVSHRYQSIEDLKASLARRKSPPIKLTAKWAIAAVTGLLLLFAVILWPKPVSSGVAGTLPTATLLSYTGTPQSLPQAQVGSTPYFVSNRDGKREIYRFEGGKAVQVTATPGSAESWDPFLYGNALYFTSNRDGKNEIYRKVGDSLSRMTTTEGAGESWDPFVSAGALYFTSDRYDNKREIYQLIDQKINRMTITEGNAESWDPFVFGGSLYFTSNRNDNKREIYQLADQKITRMTITEGSAESWDPFVTAGFLYFTSNRYDGKREIYQLADQKITRMTTTDGTSESWDPMIGSESELFFTSNRAGSVDIYQLKNQKVTGVTTSLGEFDFMLH